MCTLFTGFIFIKSLNETNNLLRGTAIFRTEIDEYEEIIYKKFCGLVDGGDQNDKFQTNQIVQVVGRFAIRRWPNICMYQWICINGFIF